MLVQTTLLPDFFPFNSFYDLMLPIVLYIAVFRPAVENTESVFCILFFGFIMDNINGGPVGLFPLFYLGAFLSIKLFIMFVYFDKPMVLTMVAAISVLAENIVFYLGAAILGNGSHFLGEAVKSIFVQIVWAIITGAFFITYIRSLHLSWEKWTKNFLIPQSKNGR